MRNFRNDILSMISKHGPPDYFATISSADSIGPETFVEISNGKISLEKARSLSSKERADLLAHNPVDVTKAWKNRINAVLDLILNGQSKPLGDISDYVWEAEWQNRLSEHHHFLFWKKKTRKYNLHDIQEENDLNTMISFAESVATATIPNTSSNIESTKQTTCDEKNRSTPPSQQQKAFQVISKEPSDLYNIAYDDNTKQDIKNLINLCLTHRCSLYYTKHFTQACKSNFPFKMRTESTIIRKIDKKGNLSLRLHLRRNNSNINPFNIGLLNIWRANMDITVLCGNMIASVIYVTYYTSKLDKIENTSKILNKIKDYEENSNTINLLSKVLVQIDTCKATGAPEAASNLLQYPQRFTSSQILRLDTRIYLNSRYYEVDLNRIFYNKRLGDENVKLYSKQTHLSKHDNQGFLKIKSHGPTSIDLKFYTTLQKIAILTPSATVSDGVGRDFKIYLKHSMPILEKAANKLAHYGMVGVAVAIAGEVCRSVKKDFTSYTEDILFLLLEVLKRSSRDFFTCFGDICMSLKGSFEKYVETVMLCMRQAAKSDVQVEISAYNYDTIVWVHLLREAAVEAYTRIVSDLKVKARRSCTCPIWIG